jgi:hypothetical protein
MAKINYLNKKNPDGFMESLLMRRDDLRGLPLQMGNDCRTSPERAILFAVPASLIHARARQAKLAEEKDAAAIMAKAWVSIRAIRGNSPKESEDGKPSNDSDFDGVVSAVAMQILAPESATIRVSLARFLGELSHKNVAKDLAKLAIFSSEEDVRGAAIQGLKGRPATDYTDQLMQGFRHPLPAVPQRAAEALVKLQRKDLIEDLVKILDEPDTRLPATEVIDGKTVLFVRELVRVNHHRNCLLCHSPGNTTDVPFGVLTTFVPLETEKLPLPTELAAYGTSPKPFIPPMPLDILVRIDTTYLRQDFSLMMPVRNAKPWPEMQRFDFLVRKRELTPAVAKELQMQVSRKINGHLAPNHRAAVYALRQLTGRNAESTPQAWREVLRIADLRPD